MKLSFIIFFLIMLTFIEAQFYDGVVMDLSGNAIKNAVVYYPGSSTSVKTDQLGEFKIPTLDKENELVISHADYGIESIFLADFKGKRIEVLLSEKVILSNTLAYAISKDDRAYYVLQFRNNVLGMSSNGLNAKILNEDALRFNWNENNKILEAFAIEPLIIQNKNLGYQIRYDLVSFEFNRKEKTVFYAGFPLFDELNKKTSRRVENERNTAYLGSLQHFLKSIYDNNYQQEGFRIRKLEKKNNPDYPTDSAISAAREMIKNNTLDMNDPKIIALTQASVTPKYIHYLYPDLLDRNEFTTKIEDRLFIDYEYYLDVEYTLEKETNEYIKTLPYSQQKFVRYQSSLVWNTEKVEVFSNGIHTPTNALWVSDYLGFEKLADMVPSDFKMKN